MFEFKRPSKYKKTNINVDKAIIYPAKGMDKSGIMKLASETEDEEFNLDLSTGLLEAFKLWKKDNKGTFRDFLKDNRQSYAAGGEVESLADLFDAFEKGIDVMPGEDISQYIKRIRAAEKAASQ